MTRLALSAPREDVLSMLAAAARVANGKVIPIYGAVHLSAHHGTVRWWATDADIWLGGSFQADSEEEGDGLLPAAALLAMVKNCADGPVSLVTSEKGHVELKAGAYRSRVPSLPVEDFPTLPTVPVEEWNMPRAALLQALESAAQAMNLAGSNFHRGMLFGVGLDRLTVVASDGHQLAKSAAARTGAAGEPVVLPAKAILELTHLLRDSSAPDVRYATADHRHLFFIDSDVFIARELDDKFPAWERIVPKTWDTRITANRAAWKDALARVALVIDKESFGVSFAAAAGELVLTAESRERGEASERLPVSIEGKSCEFRLNPKYVRNALDATASESLTCEWAANLQPLVFRPVGEEDALYIIQQIRK